MPRRKAREREASFEDRMQDFGEEVGRIGEGFGRRAERFGCRAERRWQNAFGIVGPLIGSIFGIIFLVLALWVLGFVAAKAESSLLLAVKGFLFENLGLFFFLFLFFNYADYFSKAYSRACRPLSPLIKAAGLTVAIWVVASAVIASGASVPGLGLQWAAGFALRRLFWVFAFFTVLGYIILLASGSPGKRAREEVFMAKAKQGRPAGQAKRLFRSEKDKVLGGVCGGIAEYLNVDPVLVRLLWVFGTLISLGTGILLYIIAWIVIPRNPGHSWK